MGCSGCGPIPRYAVVPSLDDQPSLARWPVGDSFLAKELSLPQTLRKSMTHTVETFVRNVLPFFLAFGPFHEDAVFVQADCVCQSFLQIPQSVSFSGEELPCVRRVVFQNLKRRIIQELCCKAFLAL